MHTAAPAGHPRKKSDMTRTIPHRVTAAVAGALMAAGILLGGGAVAQTRTQNLADYGSAITADDATDYARSEGVPHMSDNHKGSGKYFERMDGERMDGGGQ
jgi:hypothetical protein